MANKKIWLVMLVMALTFGFTVLGCDDDDEPDPDPGSPKSNFDGTWVNEDKEEDILILNGNDFEVKEKYKGTFGVLPIPTPPYTEITLTITHIYGDYLNDHLDTDSFEPKWYSKEEIGNQIPDDFFTKTGTVATGKNSEGKLTLTLAIEGEGIKIYIKQDQ